MAWGSVRQEESVAEEGAPSGSTATSEKGNHGVDGMSDSHKSRYGMNCGRWKDSCLESRSQKHAWSRRKKLNRRKQRRKEKKVELE